jgi:hypothetical protein
MLETKLTIFAIRDENRSPRNIRNAIPTTVEMQVRMFFTTE